MEFLFEETKHQIHITYGETFASFIKNNEDSIPPILFITNQKYYDLFADKINQLLTFNKEIDWYICSNSRHCNNFVELESLIEFVSTLSNQQDYLLIGLGNEGIVQLTSFFSKTAVVPKKHWLLPLSMNALSQSLITPATIEWRNVPTLQCSHLSEKIIVDHTLLNDKIAAKQSDFFVFLKCGIVYDYDFLQKLYKNFSNHQKLQQTSFAGMLEPFFRYYQEAGKEIQSFGSLFEQAFVKTPNGHFLSEGMRQLLGCLLQLLWSQEVNQFSFHYKNFLIWLMKLGYPIDFPKEILVSDYVTCLLELFEKDGGALTLASLGKTKGYQKATVAQLLQTVEEYQEILKEIRG